MVVISKRRRLKSHIIKDAREAKAAAETATGAEKVELTEGEQKLANATKRRLAAEQRSLDAEQGIANEAKRQAHNTAKTTRLRQERLAKEAAEREAAKPKLSKRPGQ